MGLALWSTQGHPQGVPLRGAGACLKQDLMDCDGFSGWGGAVEYTRAPTRGAPTGGGRLSEAGFDGL